MKAAKRRKPKALRTRAERNIAWIEQHCCIPEGRKIGKPFILPDYMRADFIAIYDNKRATTRRAIISRGRKNLKTSQSALIVLLHLCGPEARANSQLYSTALSRDQAAILFSIASKIVRLSPLLIEHVGIRESGKQLYCEGLGTVYRALSADAPTALGLSPALHIADELGQVRGARSELFEAMELATAMQDQPLTVIISTQAATDADLLSVLIDDAAAGNDPRTVLRLHTASSELDPFSVDAIRAANPAFDIFMNKKEVLAMAEDARRMPARQSEFENLVLNRRVEAASPFISRELWKSCSGPVMEFSKQIPVWGALDLSEVGDLTACVLIGKPNGDGVWHVKPTFWLPGDGLAERGRKDRVPYDLWHEQGFLLAAPGKSVDYEYVASWLRGEFDKYNIRTIAFDRWNMKHLKPWLLKAGFNEAFIAERFKEFGQGTQSMSPALRELEGDILNARIAHGGHPVLSMCAANCVVDGKDASNRKLSKNRSAGRIDGMVALTMARGAVPMDDAKPPPTYQILFV
ncbi:terminase TerL endonuclease subunit [Bradyrhizobium sp. JYMT SZCCT0428]|uniref:terminase TerL endonuclease subunit n=1 Tax=Bradyrhizobium sp. JYMT SZCCT0428 TaxID=2807673 RepID=UPI001BAD2C41|nr:terminase TerL endonuclease subunit [Bradyrhizobium sp. JYMT SZCCT0428]MBR1149341.1 terminase [Bradyrhizobium sp. JYMT SZCCT0428]